MSKKIAVIIVGILFLGGIFIYSVYRHKNRFSDIANIDSRGTSIIAFGDSITKGFGIGEEKAYPAIISRELGLPIRNAGRDGDNTASAYVRLSDDVLTHDPWIVIVFLGGNDFLKRTPGAVVHENLSRIIEETQERRAMVLLVGIPTVVIADYSGIYRGLSKQYHTAFVPDILSDIIGNDELMFDPVHPNEKGHEIIAERILKVLRPLIEEAEKHRE